MSNSPTLLFNYHELKQFAHNCLTTAAANNEVAKLMAHHLIEADLLGFTTHGICRLYDNLIWLQQGATNVTGDYDVNKQRLAVQSWDGKGSSGLAVLPKAIDEATNMAKQCGTGTITVHNVQHVACLAAYLTPVLEQGFIGQIIASTPNQHSVAAFNAKQASFSPNPYAFVAGGNKHNLQVDMTLATTAASKVRKAQRNQQQMPAGTLLDSQGQTTTDPNDFFNSQKPGVILPLGGETYGYKGTALNIQSDVWTMGLSNWGRALVSEKSERNVVWLQITDPSAFGEVGLFQQEVDLLIEHINSAAPIDGKQHRCPGTNAFNLKQQQLSCGVNVEATIWQQLITWAQQHNLVVPTSLTHS